MAKLPKTGDKRFSRPRSYGNSNRKPRLRKQDTLTQMDFIKLYQDHDDDTGDAQNNPEKSRKRRRETTSDVPESTPKYHTQTITQLDWSFNSAPEEDIWEPPISSPPPRTKAKTAKKGRNLRSKNKEVHHSPVKNTPAHAVPQTPVNRAVAFEVPSSQSPATPLSIRSQPSALRRSPLTERSTNIPIPFKSALKAFSSPRNPTRLRVDDTFESTESSDRERLLSSPTKQVSPPKSVRFAIAGDAVPSTPLKSRGEGFARKGTPARVSGSSPRQELDPDKGEISDSDADSEDDSDFLELKNDVVGDSEDSGDDDSEVVASQELVQDVEHHDEPEAQDQGADEDETESLMETASLDYHSADPYTHHETSASMPYSILESQRLNTQHVSKMPARTKHSDIFIYVYPQTVEDIRNRVKDHEFRVYEFPESVSRIWICELKPVRMLTCMATISKAKVPGEITDESGRGNKEFNAKPIGKNFAYEILELYELADPLNLDQIIQREWLPSTPKPGEPYVYVRPAVLDELMANLKPPIFTKLPSLPTLPTSSTDTQEVEAQMMSNIRQFTQLEGEGSSDSYESPILPSLPPPKVDQTPCPRRDNETQDTPSNIHPSQATTVDLTQPPASPILGVIRESPARPVRTPAKVDTGEEEGKGLASKSTPKLPEPVFLPSSQFLTKSQMLPHSLLDESLRGPPGWIDDSEAESEDEDEE